MFYDVYIFHLNIKKLIFTIYLENIFVIESFWNINNKINKYNFRWTLYFRLAKCSIIRQYSMIFNWKYLFYFLNENNCRKVFALSKFIRSESGDFYRPISYTEIQLTILIGWLGFRRHSDSTSRSIREFIIDTFTTSLGLLFLLGLYL